MKADLHVHTCYSPDSVLPLETIIQRTQEVELDCIAITDHNTIEGALKLKQMAPFHVIVGEEAMSSHGEIIGYFLTEEIPRGLPPEEVIARIRNQNGLVALPHPFDGFGRRPLEAPKRERLLSQIDIIEVFNARSLSPKYSEQAHAFANEHGLLKSAGSDAHGWREVGKAYVEMPEFNGPDEFKDSLSQGKIFGQHNGLREHFLTTLGTLPKRLRNIT